MAPAASAAARARVASQVAGEEGKVARAERKQRGEDGSKRRAQLRAERRAVDARPRGRAVQPDELRDREAEGDDRAGGGEHVVGSQVLADEELGLVVLDVHGQVRDPRAEQLEPESERGESEGDDDEGRPEAELQVDERELRGAGRNERRSDAKRPDEPPSGQFATLRSGQAAKRPSGQAAWADVCARAQAASVSRAVRATRARPHCARTRRFDVSAIARPSARLASARRRTHLDSKHGHALENVRQQAEGTEVGMVRHLVREEDEHLDVDRAEHEHERRVFGVLHQALAQR